MQEEAQSAKEYYTQTKGPKKISQGSWREN